MDYRRKDEKILHCLGTRTKETRPRDTASQAIASPWLIFGRPERHRTRGKKLKEICTPRHFRTKERGILMLFFWRIRPTRPQSLSPQFRLASEYLYRKPCQVHVRTNSRSNGVESETKLKICGCCLYDLTSISPVPVRVRKGMGDVSEPAVAMLATIELQSSSPALEWSAATLPFSWCPFQGWSSTKLKTLANKHQHRAQHLNDKRILGAGHFSPCKFASRRS